MAKHEYTKRDKKTRNRMSVRRPTLITEATTKGTRLVKEQVVRVLAEARLNIGGETLFHVPASHDIGSNLCYNPTATNIKTRQAEFI